MRAFRLRSGHRLEPFGDVPEQALFAEHTIEHFVDDACARRGIAIRTIDAVPPAEPSDDMVLLLADYVYVSDKMLGDFLAAALPLMTQHDVVTPALALTPASDFVRPVSSLMVESLGRKMPTTLPNTAKHADAHATQRIRGDVFLLTKAAFINIAGQPASDVCASLRAQAHVVMVAKRELHIPMRLPTLQGGQAPSVMPISSTVLAHVEHWVHVLWLNQMAVGIRMLERARQNKLWAASCAMRALLAVRIWQPATWLKAGVFIGKNVHIDPTANVEASIISDDVVIGPRACVRGSVVGKGVHIHDHATVISSVVGAGAQVMPRSFVALCSIYPQAVVNALRLQVSVIGNGASTSLWAGLLDAKLQGTVDVIHRGVAVSTERSFLGSCVGHRSHVDAKVLLLPGRSLPNDVVVAMRPDEVIDVIPALVPQQAYVRDGGTLVLLQSLLPPRSS
jgi:hypothetical protein